MPESVSRVRLRMDINGLEHVLEVLPGERLLDLLRAQGLTGVKEGCGEGECGACCILMDGRLVNSCLIPAIQADGSRIVTIEGAAADPVLRQLQESFIERAGAQCGICTPGMVLAAGALLKVQPRPGEGEIRRALAGNLCRCTGHVKIIDSVLHAANRLAEAGEGAG